MVKKTKKLVEKKEIKASKILTGLALLEDGELIAPTAFAKKIGMHYSTVIEKIDEYELAKGIGWINKRDSTGKVRFILRTDEDLIVRNALAEIKKEIISINQKLDEINSKKKK